MYNCRDKKTLIFFFAFPVLSGKFGKQPSRSPAAIYFFFWHYCLFVPEQNSNAPYGSLETICILICTLINILIYI
jgi:hypothetical protein